MFIRFTEKKTEVLLNTDLIWKIEVCYCAGEKRIKPAQAKGNPAAFKYYRIFFGSEMFVVVDQAEGELRRELDRIYESAK